MKAPKKLHNTKKVKRKAPVFFEKTQSKRISRRGNILTKSKPHNIEKFKKSTQQGKISTEKKSYKNTGTKKTTPKAFTLKKKKVKVFESTLLPNQKRLEKYIAETGMASRREAKDLIRKGLVTINGKVIHEPGHGINPKIDKIKITGGVLENKETILFYKPRGIETVKTSSEAVDIHDKFPQFKHLAPIGRLDKDSEGLILLSNDGVLTRVVTGENSSIDKEYRVTVREDVIPAILEKMEHGIKIGKIVTKPCITKKVAQNEFSIVLHEGHKHQVRRMANACKLTVTRLIRVRIGDLVIGKMTAGNFKRLPEHVIKELKK